MTVLPIAAGPTAYDVATGVIALIGVGLSAYGLRRQVRRETRSVKVTCRYSFAVGPIAAAAPERMVTVDVLNEGHRPVDVTAVGFELKDGRQPLVLPVPLNGPVNMPQTLNDGATATVFFDLAQLDQAEAQSGQRIRSAFVDASGARYRGEYVKR